MAKPQSQGISLKKQFGQHFLRVQSVVDNAVAAVSLDRTSSVFEIGCGDGFLTRTILKAPIGRLWVFEIDPEWVEYVSKSMPNPRLTVFHENILDVDFKRFEEYQPWTLLANLPYQITFPILHLLQKNRALLKEGVIMVQEEVAQKILKTSGRGYGFPALYFQHYFEWRALDKISPSAFFPPPKVNSRLLYFKPKQTVPAIPHEEHFWKFIKTAFRQPRRTLRNNLGQTHYNTSSVAPEVMNLRAQQLSFNDLLTVWDAINN